MNSNVYDDVTDFEVCGFCKNTNIYITFEEKNNFLKYKKKRFITH